MLKKKIWWLSGLLALLCILSVTELTAAGVYAQKWLEATVGTNLALGKKVIFSMTPKYGLTSKNGTDAVDLTDGLLATYPEDKIWFDDKAVGWWEGSRATEGINLLLDLGKESKVDRVVIRCLGGSEQNSLHAPKQFDVFVSKDGVKFYQTASLQKLEPSERAQSDFNKYYFLEEQQVAWVYPFVLAVQADARYIGVRIRCKTDSLFIDELAVMEATPGEGKKSGFNKAYSGEANAFVTRGIIVKPRINKLVISTNIPTPTSLIIQDMRDAATAKNTAQLVMELPEGITVTTTQQTVQTEKIKLDGRDYTRLTMPLPLLNNWPQTPMFFFKAEKTPASGVPAVFYVLCDGEVPLKQVVPVELIIIPEVTPALKRLHVSLTWMAGI
ncbi:MAG: hypothetical protein NTY10_02275 [Candidatus Omnitrophica bacterium]|nr:hypothetical protein [Candidatus Omnitrophota bacterium]